MDVKRTAANCQWARPTLFEPDPTWLEASDRPWACERDTAPKPLDTTEICADCPRWEPRTPSNPPAV